MTTDPPNRFVCDCGFFSRSACQGEPFFKELEGKRYCVLHYPDKDKIEPFRLALERKLGASDFDFSALWFPEVINFDNFTFSAKAYFNNAIFSADAIFYNVTFSEYANFNAAAFKAKVSFDSATFSEYANFGQTTFSADASFQNAKFRLGASFDKSKFSSGATFYNTTFSSGYDAHFHLVTFSAFVSFECAKFEAGVRFHFANFCSNASFQNATFSPGTSFYKVTFNADVNFDTATFNADADFSSATFKSYASFAGSIEKRSFGGKPQVNFQFAHFEKPERVSFHTLDLRPHWFINVDSRKFEFTDVEFNYVLVDELASLKERGVSAPHRLLAIACRQLADNAEANHRYGEASELRFSAFEARRIEKSQPPFPWQSEWWHSSAILIKKTLERTFTGIAPWRLEWWYWLASGYGESVMHAFAIFVLILSMFALGYKAADFDPLSKTAITQLEQATSSSEVIPIRLNWSEAMRYSVNVALLQKPEPKPRGGWSWLVTAETILGPAQAALLALAVRRRFMR